MLHATLDGSGVPSRDVSQIPAPAPPVSVLCRHGHPVRDDHEHQPNRVPLGRIAKSRARGRSERMKGFGSAWGEEAELVAFRVGEDRPRDIALAEVDGGGAESPQSGRLGLWVVTWVRADVEMDRSEE